MHKSSSTEGVTAKELVDLAAAVGAPSREALELIAEDAAASVWAGRASEIASTRVVTDCTRLFGQAWQALVSLPEESQAFLHGVTRDMLAVGVLQTAALSNLLTQHLGARQIAQANIESRAAGVSDLHTRGIALRDQLAQVLSRIAGPDAALRRKIEAQTGVASDERALAVGLEQLAAAAHTLLTSSSPATKRRVKVYGLHTALLGEATAVASKLRALGATNTTDTARLVDQSRLDELDAQCLYVLAVCVGAFEAAHARDASIPRLAPIALARAFGHHGAKAHAPAPEPPATPPAT